MMKNFFFTFYIPHLSKIFINPLLRINVHTLQRQHINSTPKVIHSLKTQYRLITSTTTTTTTTTDTTDATTTTDNTTDTTNTTNTINTTNTTEQLHSSLPTSKRFHIPSFSTTTKNYLNRLRNQLHYYAVIEIRSQKFLITKNDLVTTNRLRDVDIGDEIKLNRVLELGSKDYTIKGRPLVSEAFYSIKATVIEQPKGPFIEIFKKKQRNRHRRRITHKQTYTVLRISEVEINKL